MRAFFLNNAVLLKNAMARLIFVFVKDPEHDDAILTVAKFLLVE